MDNTQNFDDNDGALDADKGSNHSGANIISIQDQSPQHQEGLESP